MILSPARMAEVGLLLAVVAVPILIGVGMSYLRRPWWWGAATAICIFLVWIGSWLTGRIRRKPAPTS